jgi:tellurite resistance-related uncharacterized protein
VRQGGPDDNTRVEILTPLGDLSVRTDVESLDTGLPVYPGSRPIRKGAHEPDNAEVRIGAGLFGLEVIAAKFESDADPAAIVDFYKGEMRTYGNVTECHGNIDFRGRRGARKPICKHWWGARAIQLVVGTEEHHRLVSVEPRAGGAEFAVVSIQTHGQS